MDMVDGATIADARLTDWRKLAQGLHARFAFASFVDAARFVLTVAEHDPTVGSRLSARLRGDVVDLELVSHDAVYREPSGVEHVVEWVTHNDIDTARRLSRMAADVGAVARPTEVSQVELGIDTADSSVIAPVWAALLTGDASSQGRGSLSDEVRDAAGRVPNLWFGGANEHGPDGQRVHVEVYIAPEIQEQRVAAAVAAGGRVLHDAGMPELTVIADQDGNRGTICADLSAAFTPSET